MSEHAEKDLSWRREDRCREWADVVCRRSRPFNWQARQPPGPKFALSGYVEFPKEAEMVGLVREVGGRAGLVAYERHALHE